METTEQQFEQIIKTCKEVFINKMHDYSTAWRVLRPSSLTDQIFIKAQRIRSIETKGTQKIGDTIRSEFIGIVNYAVIALIQIELGVAEKETEIIISPDKASKLYDKYINAAMKLMSEKNHDYDEAWRNMRISSFTDLILMKLFRTKQIENIKGKTIVSEGVDANYYDIINYAIFALIKLDFGDK